MQANLSTASSCPTLLVLGSGCEADYGESRTFPAEPGHTLSARGIERGKGISYLQKSVKCCITLSRLSLILFKLESKLTC